MIYLSIYIASMIAILLVCYFSYNKITVKDLLISLIPLLNTIVLVVEIWEKGGNLILIKRKI